MREQDLIWIEVIWREDWLAYRQDKEWKKYSLIMHKPLKKDELCDHRWHICKVKDIWDYKFKVLSFRDDK